MVKLSKVESIGAYYGQKLETVGITPVEQLLALGSIRYNRKRIAEKAGIAELLLLAWVNRADLSRIKGVGGQYSDLLEWSGVSNVPDLALNDPRTLLDKMRVVNKERKLVRVLPSIESIKSWVSQARGMPRAVHH